MHTFYYKFYEKKLMLIYNYSYCVKPQDKLTKSKINIYMGDIYIWDYDNLTLKKY